MDSCAVVFITDKGFAVPTLVAITSLLENKKGDIKYHIYLIKTFNIDWYEEKVKNIADKYNVKIDVIYVDKNSYFKQYRCLQEHDCNATLTALLKFDIPNLCKNEKKALYIDGDVIIQSDLGDIFEIHFESQKCIQAVLDSGVIYADKDMCVTCFNSGIMYMDLEYMRQNDIPSKLILRKLNDDCINLMDQKVFNEVLKENFSLIPHKYNVLYPNLIRAKHFKSITIEKINECMGTSYVGWEDIYSSAVIIHYASFEKPWLFSDVVLAEDWEYYYSLVDFDQNLPKRKKLYLKFIYSAGTLGKVIWHIQKKISHDANSVFVESFFGACK